MCVEVESDAEYTLERPVDKRKGLFVPDVGFYALYSFSISPPPPSAAALHPSRPPFTAQLHFFHFTSAIPSWHTKKSKHTHECLPSNALLCSFSSIYRRPEKRAAGAAAPFHLPRTRTKMTHAPLTTLVQQREGND